MPPRKGANSDRNLAKKAAKAAEEPEPSAQPGGKNLLARVQRLAQGCVLYEAAPKIVPVLLELKTEVMDAVAKKKSDAPEPKEAKKEDESAENQGDEKEVVPDFEVPRAPAALLFETLKERLLGANPLGVFPTGNKAVEAFVAMKKLEFDGGPRAKKKGNPAMDRLAANFNDLMPQYLYMLLALVTLRSFFFRSFFACLPWLMVYQFLSVWLPLEKTETIPLPLEKIPLSARVAATTLLHGLVWLFLVYEFVVQAYWLEWFLIGAGFTGIAYVFCPLDA